MTRFIVAALGGVGFASAALAQPAPSIALSDSFRVGTSGVLCTAQNSLADRALTSMFDNARSIVCRDAAAAVGKLYALRARDSDPLPRLAAARASDISCDVPAPVILPEVAGAMRAECRSGQSGLRYFVYTARERETLFAAEGLAGYDSALQLGLRSLIADRQIAGAVEVAVTEAGDPAAFARVQAGNLDAGQALAEGYQRNNAGSYAEASEFFDTLILRSRSGTTVSRNAEYLANQALQQSNLGSFAEAESLFARAIREGDRSDPLISRMLRNFRAMHMLNQGKPIDALQLLADEFPMSYDDPEERTRLQSGFIDRPIAQRLNSDDEGMTRLGGGDAGLTETERAQILDAQGLYLRGAALRLLRRPDEARIALTDATQRLAAVRGGRVTSVAWLRSGTLTELSAIAESEGRAPEARRLMEEAVALYEVEYPISASLLAARARLAALLARQGDTASASAMFRQIVDASSATPGAGPILRTLVKPYFDLLVARGNDDAAAQDFFVASQILARPGVAQTQAVLARELSGGSDEASRLFRLSVTLSRDIVRLETEIGRLSAKSDPTPDEAAALTAAQSRRSLLGAEQTTVLAQLTEYPRYRAISGSTLAIDELRKALKPGEAYYKLVLSGEAAFGLLATSERTTLFPIDARVSELDFLVRTLRDTIVKIEDGQPITYPFDVATARRLYTTLFGPVDAQLRPVQHLVFEPDGPLLQLPVNLLIAEQAGVDAYLERARRPDADQFDLRGINWLGRDRIVSTAVSPRSFVDVRAVPPSRGAKGMLGLGENAPPVRQFTSLGPARDDCDWPLTEWTRPISPAELRIGAAALGTSEVVTGNAFSDSALLGRGDLAQFKVLHFATHGLVTAPRPECPARPALLTSFGDANSDGLLSFREIFDLRLDADTVILSACDTAGMATVAATREAGISTGGNFALDGLVRAFVGAGARSVIASHWPVPDDYDATKRLITGLYTSPGQISVGDALRRSQLQMMDDPATSHPYYWSGFAIVGDAAKPLTGS